ncbi:MAG TPA: FISUMP domain-containing protein [Candidatus Saccharibacteria bacterium]|nr:FISUMP domain-containing protein [Candidatus Saccharibacteria bacterium]HMR38108.1 FISUMP domain-containing protein [Candidatus Saccharibacteria bacterium]
MQSQTLTQTITLLVGDTTAGGGTLASTGISSTVFIAIAFTLILSAILLYRFATRRGILRSISSFRNLGIFAFLALGIISLALNLSTVSAAPTLILAANQSNLEITIPKNGGTATTTTTMTTSTANATGYTLTASLEAEEPGIGIALKGGDVTTNTALAAGETPLTLKSTNTANTGDATDTTAVELSFTIDSTVTEGTKELKLTYKATDNESAGPVTPPTPTTMQSLTQDYCTNHMTIYNGTNEDAILTLQDNRGATPADYRTYQVAKLADNKCWMLDNLKLGSTTGTTTLTSADSNVASNFTLPQVGGNNTLDYDNPRAYGPVPGDTGNGATNYGYLYNWSAATAGETQASITSGNAAHSICARGWRLPTGGTGGDFAQLDQAFGGSGTGSWSGEANIAQWQHNGLFKGVFAGSWWEGFLDQGDWGYLWPSSAAVLGWSGGAFNANFNAGGVDPGNSGGLRGSGFGVRCLLN